MTPDQRKIIGLKRQIAHLKKKLLGQTITKNPGKSTNKAASLVSYREHIEALEFARQMRYTHGRTFNYNYGMGRIASFRVREAENGDLALTQLIV